LFRVAGNLRGRFKAADVEIADVFPLNAPAVDLDLDLFGEFSREVFDVDAGSAIDVGWIFTGY